MVKDNCMYMCEICDTEYSDKKNAIWCENQVATKKYGWIVGDLAPFKDAYGRYHIGKITGDYRKNHYILPILIPIIDSERIFNIGQYDLVKLEDES